MTQEYLTDIVLIINNIVGLFVVLRYFNHIFDRKEFASINKKLGLMLLLAVAIAMNIIFEKLSSNLFFGLILNYCIGHIFYNGKRHIKLVVAIFIVVFSFITELMTAALFGVVFNASIQGVRDNVMHLFLGGIVSKILLMLLVEIIIRFRKRNASKVSVGSWLLIVSIPICSIVLAVTSVYKPIVNNTHSDVAVIACLAIVYINVITFYLFDNIISQIGPVRYFV